MLTKGRYKYDMPHARKNQDHTRILGQKTSRGGTPAERFYSLVPFRSPEERIRQEEVQRRAIQQKLFDETQARFRAAEKRKPISYERPAYKTPQYWQDCACGWITDEEQRQDHADFETRRRRALDSKHDKASPPHRHDRAAPRSSKQFSKSMSTQAARDDRLTPQSKALLQVLVARTGRGRFTDTTKTTLGIIMNRCPRSIQRYVQELIQFGYIRTQVRKSRRTGFFVGLRVWVMDSVLPFFAQKNINYAPEKWLDLFSNRRNREETIESLTNNKDIILNAFRGKKPPWFAEFTF